MDAAVFCTRCLKHRRADCVQCQETFVDHIVEETIVPRPTLIEMPRRRRFRLDRIDWFKVAMIAIFGAGLCTIFLAEWGW